jgi:pimeloyl-ACP methyl ester carboxylesterase
VVAHDTILIVTTGLPPLVLLHGLTRSGKDWREMVPLLSEEYAVYAPTALGHHGGPQAQGHPVTIWNVVDELERYLDEQGLDRPQLVGHSMGGFAAIELARRGRAASVCAIAPAGFWSGDGRAQTMRLLRREAALIRTTRPIIPALIKPASLRRFAFRVAMLHGDRINTDRAMEIVEDTVACAISKEIFDRANEYVAPMDPLPCPITIAWAEKDVLLPLKRSDSFARKQLPHATFTVLADVGHDAMSDNSELVLSTVRAACRATT